MSLINYIIYLMLDLGAVELEYLSTLQSTVQVASPYTTDILKFTVGMPLSLVREIRILWSI